MNMEQIVVKRAFFLLTAIISLLLFLPVLNAFESQAKWIWRPGDKAEYGEILLYRKEFVLDAVPTSGFFNVQGDDHFTLYLNGEFLFKQSGFITHTIDARKLKAGHNVISAVIKNDKDIAGLLIYGEIEVAGKKMTLLTDRTWKVHAPDLMEQTDWKMPGYDDSGWKNAEEISCVTTKNVWRNLIKREMFLSKEELAEIRSGEIVLENRMKAAHEAIRKKLAGEEKIGDVCFIRRGNVPFISIDNGKKILSAPYFNSLSYSKKPDAGVFEKLQRYGKAGWQVASAGVQMSKVWVDEDTIDISSAEKSMIHVLSAFENSYLIIHINLVPPKWFMEKYPDELIRYASGDTLEEGDDAAQRVPRPSMASELWMKKSGAALEKIIRKLESTDAGKRIIGYQLNYGVYSEWHYYGMEKHMPDISKPMQSAFTRYLKKKYRSDKELQKAWKDSSVTLANAKIPDAEKRKEQKQDIPLLPGGDARCQDFYDCIALTVNHCQEFFDSTAKKACKRKILTGNYSGYFFSMPYPAIAYQTRTPEMLDSDAFDYQVSPFSYLLGHRGSGGCGLIRSPFETYPHHGKVAILEADNRTHQATTRSGNACKNAADSVGQISREFCNALTKGSALWYYDFNCWWYDYPEYYELFPKLLEIWGEENDVNRVSEVAGVCDYDSIAYHTAAVNPNRFTDKILGDVCNEMYYAGAPFDSILLEDIGKPGTPEYKVYVFFNLVHVTEEKMKKVEDLIRKGAMLVFICAPELEKRFADRKLKNVYFNRNRVLGRRGLKKLIRDKGIHIYSDDPKAVLFASRGLVGIHRKTEGPAEIRLPGKASSIEQLLPVRKTLTPSDVILYEHGPSETSLFRIKY